jgi:hypothetical protein
VSLGVPINPLRLVCRTPYLSRQVAAGLLYTHSRLSAHTSMSLEEVSFLCTLVELLSEKGLTTIEELDERGQVAKQRLAKQFRQIFMIACHFR